VKYIHRLVLAIGVLLAALSAGAFAAYPERIVRIVVPFAPGGGTDAIARALAHVRGIRQMIAQEGRIIGERHQDEDGNEIGHPEPGGAMPKKIRRPPARKTVAHEQARNEEHAGHEEAVVEHAGAVFS